MLYRLRISLLASLLAAGLTACASSTPSPSAPDDTANLPPATSPAAPEAPTVLLFIDGRWESTDPANRWQMSAAWVAERGRFEGKLTENGDASAAAGFKVGEIVWIATPQADDTVRESQLFRTAPGAAAEWEEGTVDVAQSTPERMVTSFSVFQRLP
jgi:hypothetical protein